MNTQRINISLPKTLIKQLNQQIPQGKRSDFIAKAVSDKLKIKQRKISLEESLFKNRAYYERATKEIEEDFKYADAEILERLP